MGVKKSIKVRQYKEGKLINEYRSIGLAERSLSMPRGTLCRYFKRNGSLCYGFKWVKCMGIRLTTKLDEIHNALIKEAERAEMLTIRALSYLGEQCVTRVRDRGGDASWYDQTGNLRSSVGYVIAHNGSIIRYSDFNLVKQGSEGVKAGKDLATGLVRRYSNGYVLIVVAGMNYAEHVEAMDNKDVLASTELWATGQVPKMLEKLKRQIAG